MAGSWLAVAVGAVDHPKLVGLRSDSARWGWLVLVSAAKQQDPEGRFGSIDHLRHCLARYARHAEEYLSARLADELEDGSIVVHNWSRWQQDRQTRYRMAHREELAEKQRARRRSSVDEPENVATPSPQSLHDSEPTVATPSPRSDATGTGTGTRTGTVTTGEPSPPSPPADDGWDDLLLDLAAGIDRGQMPSSRFVRQIGRWSEEFGPAALIEAVREAVGRREADPWKVAVEVLESSRPKRGGVSTARRSGRSNGRYAAITVRDEGAEG